MEKEKLKEVLEKHEKWLKTEEGGERANLRGVDLNGAELRGADLSYADLSDANLRYANLHNADLRGADLNGANLRGANLHNADLNGANLRGANLHNADLRGANLDFSQLNLSCNGLNFKIDERLAKQLMYHVINLMQYSDLDVSRWVKKQAFKDLETSHLVTEHDMPKLKGDK